jgi:hypothetical protein
MTLSIAKLTTRCRAPRDSQNWRALIDAVAREHLPTELGAHLGPSLDRLPAVIRLKRLDIKLKLPARDLRNGKWAATWARALTVSLHQALARPAGDGVISSRRHDTQATYKAAMIHRIATQGLAPSWEFPELEAWSGLAPAQATLAALLEEPLLAGDILAELERRGGLDPVILAWDELAQERVMQAVAITNSNATELTLPILLEILRATIADDGLRTRWPLGSRRQAMRLWVRLDRHRPLRMVWEGLRVLAIALERPELLTADSTSVTDTSPVPDSYRALLREIARQHRGEVTRVPSSRPHSPTEPSTELLSLLDVLRQRLPSASPRPQNPSPNTRWIDSDRAGLLLLLPIVRRLNLPQLARSQEFLRFGGLRALSFLLAATAMTLLEGWSIGDPLDPIAALFAGMLAEPDRAGLRHFFAAADLTALQSTAALNSPDAPASAPTWPDALQTLSTALTRELAAQVPGFRRASRQSVVKQFLRVPGRVGVGDDTLLVILNPSPWAVALRLGGLDTPLEQVEWLGNRRVEFRLQGL